VLTVDGRTLPIERVVADHGALCWDGVATRPIVPCHGALPRGTRMVLRLALANGRELRVTADHQLRTPDGWAPAGALRRGDRVACVVARGLPDAPIPEPSIPLDVASPYAREVLCSLGWLPVRPSDERFPALLRLLGYVCGDGHLSRDGKFVSAWTVEPAAADALLGRFELGEKRDTLAQELSRGMRQKVAICCAYLHRPRLIMLDEPLTGLDPRGIRTMKQSLLEQAAAGNAVVVWPSIRIRPPSGS